MPDRATLDGIPGPAQGLTWTPVSLRDDLATAIERSDTIRDQSFLVAFLPYAVAQARRHLEPVSILGVATDRLSAIRELHGADLAEAAVRRVAEVVARTLRASDVITRLDDGRIVAVLPFAGAEDLPMLAEAVREAIAQAGRATRAMPRLTGSIGMAAYPEHAHDARSLLTSALGALDRARSLGPNHAAEADPAD